MILRDAVISDQRRALLSARAERASQGVRETPSTAALSSPVSPVEEVPATQAAPAPAKAEPKLTFESVAAWLMVQDDETRTACASVLARELAKVHEAAKAEGYAEGQAAGQKAATQKTAVLIAQLQKIVETCDAAFVREQEKLSENCVDIVTEVFAKIAGTALASRGAIVGAVGEVLKRVREGRELMIRVNAGDLAVLKQEEEQLGAVLPGRKFSLVADSRVELGGCIVESKSGSLDGRLDRQLQELYETLRVAKSAQVEVS